MSDRFEVELDQLPRLSRDLGTVAQDVQDVLRQVRGIESRVSGQAAQRGLALMASARQHMWDAQRSLESLEAEVGRRGQQLAIAEASALAWGDTQLRRGGQAGAADLAAGRSLLMEEDPLLKGASSIAKGGQELGQKYLNLVTMKRGVLHTNLKNFGRMLNSTVARSPRGGWVGRMDGLAKLVPRVRPKDVPVWAQPKGSVLGRGVKGLGLVATFGDELIKEQGAGRTGADGAALAATTTTLGTVGKWGVKTLAEIALTRVAPRLVPGVGWVLATADLIHLGAIGLEWVFDQTGNHEAAKWAKTAADITDVDGHIRDVVRWGEEWVIGNVWSNPQVQNVIQNGQLPLGTVAP